jgi:hypothetical protein
MKSILIKEDLWDLVDESPAHAESSSKDKGKTDTSEESPHTTMTDLDKLRKRRQRTKSIIELSVEVNLRVHVVDKNNPRIA